EVRLARPHLLSAHHPVVAVALCAAAQRCQIGAGVRLREAEAPDVVRGQDARQVASLLPGGTGVDEDRADDVHGHGVEDLRCTRTRHLPGEDDLLLQRPAAAAVLARPLDADPSAAGELALPGALEVTALGLVVGR